MAAASAPFSASGFAGWNRPAAQIMVASAAVILALALVYENALLLIPLGALPFIPAVLQQPAWLAFIFVCFSFFRLNEAYPSMPARLALLSGTAALAGMTIIAISRSLTDKTVRARFMLPALTATIATVWLNMSYIALVTYVPIETDGLRLFALGNATLSALAIVFWYKWLEDLNDVPAGNELLLFVLFFIFVTFGAVTAAEPQITLSAWGSIYWKIAAVTLLLAWAPRRPEHFIGGIIIILIAGTLVGLVAIYNKIYGIDLVEGTRVTIGRTLYSTPEDIENARRGLPLRGSSKLGDPNDLALVLMFPFGLALAFLMRVGLTRPLSFVAAACLPIIVAGILFTQSRGAALGLLATSGLLGLILVRSKALLAFLGVAALLLIVWGMDLRNRESGGVRELSERGGLDDSAQQRIETWTTAFNMAAYHPFTGVGMYNFPSQYFYYTPRWRGIARAPHSTWLGVLAETGLIGFGLFLGMFLAAVSTTRKAIARAKEAAAGVEIEAIGLGLLAGLVGFAVSGAFLTQGFSWPIYILVGLVTSFSRMVYRVSREHETQRPSPEKLSRKPRFGGYRAGVARS